MGIFARLGTLIKSNINDLISRSEDPEKMLNQVLLDMQQQLVDAKKSVAVAIADEKKLQKQHLSEVDKAKVERQEVIKRMDEVTEGGGVVCLPTSPAPAPPVGQSLEDRRDILSRIVSLTCVAGTTGRPQISVPVAEVDGLPVGLSFMGERGSDELLISLARELIVRLAA